MYFFHVYPCACLNALFSFFLTVIFSTPKLCLWFYFTLPQSFILSTNSLPRKMKSCLTLTLSPDIKVHVQAFSCCYVFSSSSSFSFFSFLIFLFLLFLLFLLLLLLSPFLLPLLPLLLLLSSSSSLHHVLFSFPSSSFFLFLGFAAQIPPSGWKHPVPQSWSVDGIWIAAVLLSGNFLVWELCRPSYALFLGQPKSNDCSVRI